MGCGHVKPSAVPDSGLQDNTRVTRKASDLQLNEELKAGHIPLAQLKEILSRHGKLWKPDNVHHKKHNKPVEIRGKSYVPSMTSEQLLHFEELIKPDIPKDEKHRDLWELLDETKASAAKFLGKSVQLPYLLVLYTSKWNVLLESEEINGVPFHDLDFLGASQEYLDDLPYNGKAMLNTCECIRRGYHKGQCNTCDKEMSQHSGAMTSALVDGFSGPMEIAITSCIGLPRVWNFNAGLAETCGTCFCCYFLPHNILWFEVWAANVLRDALVGKSTEQRVSMAVVHDGGRVGNYMQQMELPFAYLYDLPVLLFESSKLRNVLIETRLMQRTVEFVTGSDDSTLQMWTMRGEAMGTMTVGETVTCVDITHDWIFAGDFTGSVHKYQRSDHVCQHKKAIHQREVRSLIVALGCVFTASADQTVKMSDIESLDILQTFRNPEVLGRVNCIAVGIDFFFTGGEKGSLRLSHRDRSAKAAKIKPETGRPGMSHMVLNSRSLFMISKEDDKGRVYWMHDSYKPEEELIAKPVFTAEEPLRSLALGGSHLFVATGACIYKLDAREPWEPPIAGINVTPKQKQVNSKVWVLKVFGEIAVVGYFPGTWELGIFNTKTGGRVALDQNAFEGHKANINCAAVG